jgi:hypothetical protein
MIHGRDAFLVKTTTLNVNSVSVHCRAEQSLDYLSTTLLAYASRHHTST